MIPSEHEGTVAVDAAARRAFADLGGTGFDSLSAESKRQIKEQVLSIVWAALEALPDRRTAAAAELEAVLDQLAEVNRPGLIERNAAQALRDVETRLRALATRSREGRA